MQISKRGQAIAPSMTLAIDAKAKKMQAEGLDVIGFGAGEPDYPTPEWVKQAAVDALARNMTRYTPATGSEDLRRAICEKLQRDNGLAYQPSQIVVSNGAKHSLYNAFMAILNPGDEVIMTGPYWVSYPEMVAMADGISVFVPTCEENGFKMTRQALAQAITPKTRALVLNNPGNPCGNLYQKEELEWIAELAVKHDIWVISDEIYDTLVYDGPCPPSIASLNAEICARTIVVNGLSKSHAMTGWRIGYAAAPAEVAAVMGAMQSHATSNPNSIAQHAAAVALRGTKQEVEAMRDEFKTRRDAMVARINDIPGVHCHTPGGAFYVMMNVSALFGKSYEGQPIDGSMTLCSLLLEKANVAMVPGLAFGDDNLVRLSYAIAMDKMLLGLDRFAAFVAQMK